MLDFEICKSLNGANGAFTLRVQAKIAQGERIGIMGSSGAGKSTLLRILSGLQRPDSGKIYCDHQVWFDQKISLPPQKRKIGFVFQNYMLFPNLSILENISYGANANLARVEQLIEIMQLSQIIHQLPSKLSGGQCQRVALARALAIEPKILLLDEPLSALDYELKNEILEDLQALQKELKFTLILVSHSLSEVYRLSDRILTLQEGKIQSFQTPQQFVNDNHISLEGEILHIEHHQLTAEVTVLIAQEVLCIVCNPQEICNFKVGDRISLLSKVFSPILKVSKM